MTNFSGAGRTGLWSWLSPERAVLVLPVFAGLGLSVLVFSAGITPLKLRVDEQQTVVDDLSFKSEMLPLLEQERSELKLKQAQREQQLDRLLALVAGTSELNTFLAELNDLGNTHRVAITTTEPGEVQRFIAPSAPSGQEAPPAAGGGQPAAASGDALLNKGLEKRSAGLTVQGAFPQVLAFLQALERLQVFVVVSEMDVKAVASGGEAAKQSPEPEVTMALKLTAYGQQPEPDVPKEDS